MPTNVLLSIEQRRIEKKKNSANLLATLLLLPLIACLISIMLSMESAAFETALIALGTME